MIIPTIHKGIILYFTCSFNSTLARPIARYVAGTRGLTSRDKFLPINIDIAIFKGVTP